MHGCPALPHAGAALFRGAFMARINPPLDGRWYCRLVGPGSAGRAVNFAMSDWEHFAHEADMGVRGFGSTLAEAFEHAAEALTAVIADLATIEPRESVDIGCEAPDDELLFAEWLNSLVYEMATRRMLFSRFSVRLDGTVLNARVWGEPVDVERHRPAVEVKGATYTALRVAFENGRWLAQTVVDV
jgi:SHS2 domain-containing protein